MRKPAPLPKFLLAATLLAAVAFLAGCQQESTEQQYQDDGQRALQDPMNYTPDMSDTDIPDMNQLGSYNSKAMERDWDDFWNP